MINWYKNLKSGEIDLTTSIEDVLDTICNGNDFKSKISEAREAYLLDKERYKEIKEYCLPCYTLNFEFFGQRKKSDIKESTGFIYLDVDNETEINLQHDLIYASWISLSGSGRGLLVKTEGITVDNFNKSYHELSKELSLNTDRYAAKSTQPNILSYDPNLYLNKNAITWRTNSTSIDSDKKTYYSYIEKERKERKDGTVLGKNHGLMRFSNLPDFTYNIDFDGVFISI